MTNREVFYKMLPYFMGKANVNQTELAAAAGVTRSTVHYWLTGKSFPRIDVIQKIADRLGCKTDDLLVETETTPHAPRRRIDPEIRRIVEAELDYNQQMQDLWDNAPDWVKRVAISTLRSLMNEAEYIE